MYINILVVGRCASCRECCSTHPKATFISFKSKVFELMIRSWGVLHEQLEFIISVNY